MSAIRLGIPGDNLLRMQHELNLSKAIDWHVSFLNVEIGDVVLLREEAVLITNKTWHNGVLEFRHTNIMLQGVPQVHHEHFHFTWVKALQFHVVVPCYWQHLEIRAANPQQMRSIPRPPPNPTYPGTLYVNIVNRYQDANTVRVAHVTGGPTTVVGVPTGPFSHFMFNGPPNNQQIIHAAIETETHELWMMHD